MKSILCPIDFSNTAMGAAHFGARLASELDAKLVLMNVLHVPNIEVGSTTAIAYDLMEGQQKQSEDKLNAVCKKLNEEYKVNAIAKNIYGLAADAIIRLADEEDVDMILMGTNGASDQIERWLGTVSYAVVKNSKQPVMVIPKGFEYKMVKHVAIANDHKDDISETVSTIQSMNLDLNRPITSVSVEEDDSPGCYREEVITQDKDWGEVCIWADSVLNGLDRYVEIHKVDLLVIKKHHRNFFDSFIHRSVTKEILENLHVPVIVHP